MPPMPETGATGAPGSGGEEGLRQFPENVLVELAAAVIEVNADFFVQKVLPKALDAAERIASGGTSGLPDSAAPVSPITT